MIVISGALVLVALVLLVLGLVGDTLALVYASIGVTVLSGILLGAAVVKNRRQALPGDAPTDDLLPGGLHDDATLPPADAGEQPAHVEHATPSPVLAASEDDASTWDEEADRAGGGEVLVVPGRARYHVEGCRYLTDQVAEAIDVLDAREDGFTACGVCRPDGALGIEPVLVRSTGVLGGSDTEPRDEDEDLEDEDLEEEDLGADEDLEDEDLEAAEDVESEPVTEDRDLDDTSRGEPLVAEGPPTASQDDVEVSADQGSDEPEPSSAVTGELGASDQAGRAEIPTTGPEGSGPAVAEPSRGPAALARAQDVPAEPGASTSSSDAEIGSRRISDATPRPVTPEPGAPAAHITTAAADLVPADRPATTGARTDTTSDADAPVAAEELPLPAGGATSVPPTAAGVAPRQTPSATAEDPRTSATTRDAGPEPTAAEGAAAPRTTATRSVAPRSTASRTTAAKATASKASAAKTTASKASAAKTTPSKVTAGEAAAPRTAAPRTAAPRTAAPRTAGKSASKAIAPKTAAAQTAAPTSAVPGTASPRTAAPRTATRKVAAPRPGTPTSATPTDAAPRRVAAKAPAPRPVAPSSTAPSSVDPRPVTRATDSPRSTAAQPPANRAALAKAAASRAALAKSTAPRPAEGRAPAARPPAPTGTDPVPGQTSSSGLPIRPPSAAARAVTARAVAARTVASRAAAARSAARTDPAADAPRSGPDAGAPTTRATAPRPAGTPPRAAPGTGSPSSTPARPGGTGSGTGSPSSTPARSGGTGSRKVSAKAPSRPVVPPLDLSSPRPASGPAQGPASAGQPAGGGSVVVIPDRGRFHRADCRYVRGQAGAQTLSRDGAVRQGFQPCGVCQP